MVTLKTEEKDQYLRREVEDHLRLRGPEEGRGKGRGREAGGDERTQVSIEHP